MNKLKIYQRFKYILILFIVLALLYDFDGHYFSKSIIIFFMIIILLFIKKQF